MQQEHHPTFGQLCTKADEDRIFGAGSRQAGIVCDASGVKFIYCRTGARQKYPNSVTRDEIRYCHGPLASSNAAMNDAHASGRTFPVKVVPDGSALTYYWGMARIVETKETHPQTHCARYVLHRDIGDNTHERACTELVPHFHSVLEGRHACMMDAVGIEWTRNVPTFHGVLLGDGSMVSYTPDFMLHVRRRPIVVEIKPQYPYDDEVRRAMAVAFHYRGTQTEVFILFNTSFHSPFAARKTEADGVQGSYGHASGVRGIRFYWDDAQGAVVVNSDAAYAIEEDGTPTIAARRDVDDGRFNNAVLDAAYTAASEISPHAAMHMLRDSMVKDTMQ